MLYPRLRPEFRSLFTLWTATGDAMTRRQAETDTIVVGGLDEDAHPGPLPSSGPNVAAAAAAQRATRSTGSCISHCGAEFSTLNARCIRSGRVSCVA